MPLEPRTIDTFLLVNSHNNQAKTPATSQTTFRVNTNMALSSDVVVNAKKFEPSAISETCHKTNQSLIDIMKKGPRWYEVGAEKYRQMRWNGETPFPKPVVLESGQNSSLPSREKGRTIPTRVFRPDSGSIRGVFMHIHGGGWVLQSEAYQDTYLKFLADTAQLHVISVGYRLAPEHPHPAPSEDCYDVAEWLADNAEKEYGAPLLFAGGESAGGHLTTLVALHLLKTRPSFSFAGLLLHFGAYDLSGFLPQAHNFNGDTLVLDYDLMSRYVESYLPNSTVDSRRDPEISPFYADLRKIAKQSQKGLPPALFTCGSEDCLLDDTMMMSVKWQMAGGDTVVKIYPGAPHGFVSFPLESYQGAGDWNADMKKWLHERLGL